MKYGKDYGIKVDVPWYVKCPLLNRLFNTMKVDVSFTTFSNDGGPMIGVKGTFRVPFSDNGLDISSVIRAKYRFPNEEIHFGHGLYVKVRLVDVNHRMVFARKGAGEPVTAGFMARAKNSALWFGEWYEDAVDVKFGRNDYCLESV